MTSIFCPKTNNLPKKYWKNIISSNTQKNSSNTRKNNRSTMKTTFYTHKVHWSPKNTHGEMSLHQINVARATSSMIQRIGAVWGQKRYYVYNLKFYTQAKLPLLVLTATSANHSAHYWRNTSVLFNTSNDQCLSLHSYWYQSKDNHLCNPKTNVAPDFMEFINMKFVHFDIAL